jgi:hypothetical protein
LQHHQADALRARARRHQRDFQPSRIARRFSSPVSSSW